MHLGFRALLGSLLVVATALLAACSPDNLSSGAPTLTVRAWDEQTYQSFNADTRTLHLGEVPVYTSKRGVFELENPTANALVIDSLSVTDTAGVEWGAPYFAQHIAPGVAVAANADNGTWRIEARSRLLLAVTYAPRYEDEDDFILFRITSNADNAGAGGVTDFRVEGVGGPPVGMPDIELAYGGFTNPGTSHCATRFEGETPVVDLDEQGEPIYNICKIPTEQGLNFGNIGLGAVGTARLTIKNAAECPQFPGVASCDSCALVIDADPEGQNIGLGFAPGTNDQGFFGIVGSTNLPYALKQRDLECDEDGEVRLSLEFNAPTVEGPYSTVLIIESNDPDEPVVELPILAFARNAPVAIAKFKAQDPNNLAAPWTDPLNIEPLERVYFDGRQSFDPMGTPLATYKWEVIEYPSGTNPADFDFDGTDDEDLFSFFVPLAGHYVVRLTVTNTDGIESGDTPESRKEFDAVPGDAMHVQLVWDNATNDQDLHLTMVTSPGNDEICDTTGPFYSDCSFVNCNPDDGDTDAPIWDNSAPIDPAYEGANPSLDVDDTNGLGPENINIDMPNPGTYRVYVHYWTDTAGNVPTKNTVRIFLNGVQRGEYKRTLNRENDIWAVAEIVWSPSGVGTVSPYPSDSAGEVGAVDAMVGCYGGYNFP